MKYSTFKIFIIGLCLFNTGTAIYSKNWSATVGWLVAATNMMQVVVLSKEQERNNANRRDN